VRLFDVGIVVTVTNGKGVLARVAAALAQAEADIVHLGMTDEAAPETLDLRFVISVRDRHQFEHVLRTLQRTPSVLRASRTMAAAG
jgi:GTP pyrophosphokinase